MTQSGFFRCGRALGQRLAAGSRAWACAVVLGLLAVLPSALAATYASASIPFAWIDSSAHDKVGHNTTPYKFNGGGGCGTAPPVLDDVISDNIPLGFNFLFGAVSYANVRIQTNGRLQFNNTTCGYGTQSIGPPQTYPNTYPTASMNNTMKVFGVDLDPTALADKANYPSATRKTSCVDRATCYISVATIGAAPNRKFVVTWQNVPEWVSASVTSGSFELQVILNENGSFVFQYGQIVHGGTGTAEIGWQLSTSDFEVLKFGASSEPPPDTAIVFYVPSLAPLAQYRFEEGAWSPGAAGQVSDASGNNRPGMTMGAAQASAGGRVCRGAAIAANVDASTVDAIRTGVRFADAGVNMLGQGSVMFWYRSQDAWAGGRGAQLLDATQVAGQWFYLSRTPGGSLYFQVTDSTGIVRSVESPAQSFPANTWVHVAVTWNFNALAPANSDSIRVLVDGGAPTISAFTTTGSLSDGLDYLHAGDNPSGLVGAKGTVNSANGMIDELRIYNLALNQGQVQGERSETRPCSTFSIDHFELRHGSWSGISCVPGSITVVACQNASCSTPYTSGVVVTLSASGAATVWDPASGGATVVIGAGQSSTTRSFFTATGSATFNVAGTGLPVSESAPSKCNGAGGACVWTAANAGLALTPIDGGVITGGKPAAVRVQAVQASGPSPNDACVAPSGLSSAGLRLWTAPTSPASFVPVGTSASVSVGGPPQVAAASTGPFAPTPQSAPSVDNLTGLSFDANASTIVWLRHMDSGQFLLRAALERPASGAVTPLSLNGNVSIGSVPLGFGVRAGTVQASAATQTACASGSSLACDASAGAHARVASAGDVFATVITAALWTSDADTELGDNPVAPSYAGTVALAAQLAAPFGGTAGVLSVASATLGAGSQTVPALAWSQSGALRIAASGSYLSQSLAGRSAVLGRFSPRHFTTNVLTQGCGSFTYSGQPVTTLQVRAMDASAVPTPTPNYRGSFARAVTLSDVGGAASGTWSDNLLGAASFVGGGATASPVFTFASAKTEPLTLTVQAADGEIGSNGFAQGAVSLRSGRIAMQNAYGSEMLDLPIPVIVQHWSAGGYVINTADHCTVVPAASVRMGNFQKQLSACETRITPANNLVFAAGRPVGAGLVLGKPGAGNGGSVDLAINIDSVASGSTCVALSPSAATAANLPWLGPNIGARATFGVFKSPIIYSRENY